MKILIVNGSTVFDCLGGSEVQINYLAEFLRDQGHDVLFYTMDFMPRKPESEKVFGFRVYRNNYIGNSIRMPQLHIQRILTIVKKEAPDILFARYIQSTYVLHQVSKKLGIPFVYQVPFMFDESMYSFKTALHYVRKFKLNVLNALLATRYFYKADRVLSVSRDDALMISRRFKIPVKTIYNMHPIPPERIDIASDVFKVAWINNLKLLKRPEMFLNLAHRCADTKAHFIMAGSMPGGAYGARLRDMISSATNLEYLGQIPFEQSNRLLGNASLNVITSPKEGFSNSSIQGWLRGIPLVTTIDKDNVVTDNHIGFAVSDVGELEEKVRFYMEHPQELAAAGRRAREYAVKEHSIELNGQMYENFFKELIR